MLFRIPSTPAGIAIEILVSLVFGYCATSLFEHLIHKHLMHLKKLPRIAYKVVPHLNLVQSDHAVEHHGRFYKEFDYEPDPKGRYVNLIIRVVDSLFMAMAAAPMFLAIAVLSPICFAVFFSLAFIHNRVWGVIHEEMHVPNPKNTWKTSGIYRYLARHHFMHHQAPLSNFNVVFPGADYVLGAVTPPKLGDVKEMLRMGYLLPRSDKSARRVAALRARVQARRDAALTTTAAPRALAA